MRWRTVNAKAPLKSSRSDNTSYEDADSFEIEAQGHKFTFYPCGSDRLRALVEHIDSAREKLVLFYYMFQDDKVGTHIRDRLVTASRRGVDIHLIIDDFGSDAPAEFFEPLTDAGARFSIFAANWSGSYLIRNHQKFVIADDRRVMTGGSNISDHYYSSPDNNGWCDLGIAIEGRVVDDFARWFELLREWTETKGSQLRRIRQMVASWNPGDGPVRLLIGGPLIHRNHWAYRFKRDMRGANRLDLVTAYFGPPRSFRRQLARIASRGRVRLITAGKSDIKASIDVARLFYKRLMRAGAKIFEFQPCKLHMKLMVVDDIAYFGSANFDRRSMRINVELMVRVEDEKLAARLLEFIDHLQRAAVPIDREWYRENTSFWSRLRWRLFYSLSLADYRLARLAADDD